MQAARRPFSRALFRAGSSRAARMAMIAIKFTSKSLNFLLISAYGEIEPFCVHMCENESI